MNQLTKFLVDSILNEGEDSLGGVALFGGGFKPPTKGHLEVVLQGLKENPEVKQIQILVGSGERNGITQEESIKIWEMYKKFIPVSTQIIKVQSPFSYIKTYLQDHQDEDVYIFIGARAGNEEDDKDVAERSKFAKKYSKKAIPTKIQTSSGVSGTMARKAALSGNNKEFLQYFPNQLTNLEKKEIIQMISSVINELDLSDISNQKVSESLGVFRRVVVSGDNFNNFKSNLDSFFSHERFTSNYQNLKYNIIISPVKENTIVIDLNGEGADSVSRKIKDIGEKHKMKVVVKLKKPIKPINENASYSKEINIQKRIMQLTQHMLDKGYNIEPLPTVEFVDGDSENARDFLGKTAYYNPNNQTIVLYTEGRHPKDIVRSFAHEMIHHIQNLEGRLGNITTTNTQEDDNLNDIEAEANLKGTMTFRNWTDKLAKAIVGDRIKEAKEEVTDSMAVVLSRNDNQVNLYDLKTNEALGNINTYGNEVTGVAAKKGYGPLMYELGMANIYPNGLQSDRRGNTEPAAETIWKKYIAGASPNIKVEKLTPKDKDYRTTYAGGDQYDSSYIPDFYNYKFYNPNTTTLEQLIQRGNTLSDELREKIISDNDKLYMDLVNEAIVGDKIECDNCGWSWNIVDGGDDLFICHKCGHDNAPLNEDGQKIAKKNMDDYKKSNNPRGKVKDPFGLNAYARELALGLEEEIEEVFDLVSSVIQENYVLQDLENQYGINLDLYDNGKYLTLSRISIPKDKRGQGIGSKVMNQIIQYADKENKPIYLTPTKDFGASSVSRLEQFYKQFGFKKKDRSDFSTKETMVRIPLNEAAPYDSGYKKLNEGRYDTLTNQLSKIAFESFKDIHDRGDREGEFSFRVDHPDDEHDIPSKDFYFDFIGEVEITDDEYQVDGGANAGFDSKGEEITPLLSVKFKIPKNPDWQKVSFDIKDVVRHELEHLTQDGDNVKSGKQMDDDQLLRDLIDADMLSKSQYFKLEKEVDAMLQGLYFKAKKSKRPFKDVIDEYLNIFLDQLTITQEEKNDILDIWRSRGKSLSLPVFENKVMENKYKIYLDMDGVIVDFDKRFTDLAGMGPREYESSFGKEKFWDFIDSKEKGGGVGFWVGMDWMPGGEALYNRVAQHNHALLSSPSRSESSKIGKRLWRKKYTPSTKLILANSYNKKNYADGNNILIDDRESNIQQWREAGGIGILYKSADQVNKELDKLGL